MSNIKPILNVYLAGRIDGLTVEDATNWRIEALEKLSKKGLIGVCPITHGKELEAIPSPTHNEDIFKIDLDLIYRSEAVIANLDKVSFGTAQELFYATQCLNIPVIAYNNFATKSAFMYNTVYETVETLDDAVNKIVELNTFIINNKTHNKEFSMYSYDEHNLIESVHELVLNYTDHYYQIPLERLKPRK